MKKFAQIDGLTQKKFKELESRHKLKFYPIDQSFIKKIFRARPSSGHKGTFGHALIIAGGENTSGAGILSSMAALRAGCGLVTTSIHANGLLPLLANLPEVMTRIRTGVRSIQLLDLASYDAIGFGPGVGITEDSKEILLYLLENYKGPLIIDADGLTVLSKHRFMLDMLNMNTILTPHPGEFSRLCITDSTRHNIIDAQLDFQSRYKCVILVKGKNTTVADGSGLYYNTTGNNGMATAGSGDVLTGIITSLCAQDYSPAEAAIIGTYLHGYAGDSAVADSSMHSLIASDIINSMHSFFKKFEKMR